MDAAGDAVLSWLVSEPGGDPFELEAARQAAGGAWQAPTTVVTSGQLEEPQVALDATGDAISVWDDGGTEDATQGDAQASCLNGATSTICPTTTTTTTAPSPPRRLPGADDRPGGTCVRADVHPAAPGQHVRRQAQAPSVYGL
ncbi:MAG TPA: hypothetical protein VHX88_16760 [Solirubrobacteraceae bacterium]|nr:hypothetical protein [Solirubrobacteraceae bacterium]